MPSNEPEASGRAFLGLIRHVKDTRGSEALAPIIADAGAETREAFKRPIRAVEYYPYPAYSGLLRAIDRHLGKGDNTYARELGVVAGKRDLGTVLRVYAALASAERLIRACEKVWAAYYRNAGSMTALAWAPDDTRLRIEGFAKMHPAHCRLMEGWMTATMDTIGFNVSRGRETACTSRGGAHHDFACTWERARSVGGTLNALVGRAAAR